MGAYNIARMEPTRKRRGKGLVHNSDTHRSLAEVYIFMFKFFKVFLK